MKLNLNKVASFPVFAVLLGIFPIVALWATNKLQIKPQAAWLPLIISLLGVIVVWAVCAWVLHSFSRGNLLAAFLFLWFFSYGHIYDIIKGQQILGMELGFFKLLAAYLVLLAVLLLFFHKIKTPSSTVSTYLNIAFALLLVFNAFQIIRFNSQVRATDVTPATTETLNSSSDLPDVYYIILDAYSRQDILEEKMGYDNSAFIDALEERGFYVVKCANSNYDDTLNSVASSLNYSYLKELFPKDAENNATIAGAIQNNAIRRDMASLGYQFVSTVGYSSFNDIQDADIYLNVVDAPEMQGKIQNAQFSSLYLQTTLLRVLFELYSMNPSEFKWLPNWMQIDSNYLGEAKFWYYQTNYVFDELAKLPEKSGNYFVYAHINAPHGPYVFDSQGNFRYVNTPDDNIPYYNDAVTYVNQRVLDLIDALLSESDVPPVIILQGDHGAHVITSGTDKNKILEAYYFAGRTDIPFYDTMTPVNTFRLMLKSVFGQDIDLLPDEIHAKVDDKDVVLPSQCQY